MVDDDCYLWYGLAWHDVVIVCWNEKRSLFQSSFLECRSVAFFLWFFVRCDGILRNEQFLLVALSILIVYQSRNCVCYWMWSFYALAEIVEHSFNKYMYVLYTYVSCKTIPSKKIKCVFSNNVCGFWRPTSPRDTSLSNANVWYSCTFTYTYFIVHLIEAILFFYKKKRLAKLWVLNQIVN